MNCFLASKEEKVGELEEEELHSVTDKNLTDEVDELHDALLNHQLVRHSFQQAALKIQVLQKFHLDFFFLEILVNIKYFYFYLFESF